MWAWLVVCLLAEYIGFNFGIMANFDMSEDEDYSNMFIIQESNSHTVSLEENKEFKTVLDPKYSDISDDEQDQMEGSMR